MVVRGGIYFANREKKIQQPVVADESANWQIYNNKEHGFQLTLNDFWKGYKVEEKYDNNLVWVSLAVPTKDKNYGDKTGYVVPISIVVYPKAEWINGVNEPFDYLAENEKYVFVYQTWQDMPSDLIQRFDDFKVISTFKLIK